MKHSLNEDCLQCTRGRRKFTQSLLTLISSSFLTNIKVADIKTLLFREFLQEVAEPGIEDSVVFQMKNLLSH